MVLNRVGGGRRESRGADDENESVSCLSDLNIIPSLSDRTESKSDQMRKNGRAGDRMRGTTADFGKSQK